MAGIAPQQRIILEAKDAFNTFTLFPTLPTELRLKIWRSTFPHDRVINIEHRPRFTALAEVLQALQRDKMLPGPVALYINRESREETLRHYFVIRRMGVFEDNNVVVTPHTLYFNPKLDIPYITSASLNRYPSSRRSNEWFNYIKNAVPGFFSSIKLLQVRDVNTDWIRFFQHQNLARWNITTDHQFTLGRITELKSLEFVLSKSKPNIEEFGLGKEELKEVFRVYFPNHQAGSASVEEPSITLKPFEELPNSIMGESSNDLELEEKTLYRIIRGLVHEL